MVHHMKKGFFNRFSLEGLEEIITTLHNKLPHLPRASREALVRAMPYIAVVGAVVYIGTSVIPGVGSPFLVPVDKEFILNGLLLRLASILTGIILLFSYRHLKVKAQKGWDGLWYVSLFQVFFGLLVFNVPAIITILLMWYVLFEIKREYGV